MPFLSLLNNKLPNRLVGLPPPPPPLLIDFLDFLVPPELCEETALPKLFLLLLTEEPTTELLL